MTGRAQLGKATRTLLLSLIVFIVLFPIVWIVLTSFKNQMDTFAIPPTILRRPTLNSFKQAIGNGFLLSVRNSIVVGVMSTTVTIVLSVPASYAFARYRFPGSRTVLLAILMIKMIPGISLILPFFKILRALGLLNTPFALVATYLSFQIPFAVWLLDGFFRAIPSELEEAAILDGCSRFGAFLRVMVPLGISGIATAAIFSFLGSWNEFLYAVTFTRDLSAKTGPVAISENISTYQIYWGQMAASATMYIAPAIAFNLFFQRYIVRGLTIGAVKS